MRQRVFAKALAGWTDFALREVAYGQMGAGMPSPVSAGPAPINAIASRDRPSRMNPVGKNMLGARRARSGDITLDVVRARYADKMSTGQGSQSASGDQKKGPRSLPKPIRATRPR